MKDWDDWIFQDFKHEVESIVLYVTGISFVAVALAAVIP